MKRLLTIFSVLLLLSATSCQQDNPVGDGTGQMVVSLYLDDASPSDPPVDFSDYVVVLIPESGWIVSSPVSEITWPVELAAGKYRIAASSPMISETDTTQTVYYGEQSVTVAKDRLTDVHLVLTLTDFPKDTSSED